MSRNTLFYECPIHITKGLSSPQFPIELSECEVCILWALAEEGNLSIFDLWKKRDPKFGKKKRELQRKPRQYVVPEIGGEDVIAWRYNNIKPKKYGYFRINSKVHELERRRFVNIVKNGKLSMVTLLYNGLMVYLRHSTNKDKIKNACLHYPRFIPFSEVRELIEEKLGPSRVWSAFDKAMRRYSALLLAKFRIKHLNLEFDGLLRTELLVAKGSEIERESKMERDDKVADFLRTKEMSVLRNSYIAYLAVHDIWRLCTETSQEVEELLPTLISEKELAYLEKRDLCSDNLFETERLKEFFPRYAYFPYFLTGMFVENLLWHEKKPEVTLKQRTGTCNYEIQLLA